MKTHRWLLVFGNLSMAMFAHSATYYISPSGDNAHSGLLESEPKRTFGNAFATMGAGDELVLLDGNYSAALGTGYIHFDDGSCSDCGQPPSGSGLEAMTVVRAKNPGRVRVDGGVRDGLFLGRSTRKDSYIKIQGVTFYGGGSLYNTRFNTIKNCGFHSARQGSGAVFGLGTNDGNWGNTDNLMEDCWVWGRERIIAINYRASRNVWRRVFVRGDGCGSDKCRGSGNPNVGFTVYNSSHVSVQNVLVVDRVLGGGEGYGDFATAQHETGRSVSLGPAEYLSDNEWLGCLSLHSEDAGFHFEADNAGKNSPVLRHIVAWDNGGVNVNIGRQAVDFVLENVTVGLSKAGSDGLRVAPGITKGVVRNVTSYTAGRFGVNSSVVPSYTNVVDAKEGSYNQTRCSEGCLKVNPLKDGKTPALKHVFRIEKGSPLSGNGYQGGDYGATVVNRYGLDGTRYGEEGYNPLTKVPLWPWPNEDRIRTDMCAGEAQGFCSASSLTSYIGSYLDVSQ